MIRTPSRNRDLPRNPFDRSATTAVNTRESTQKRDMPPVFRLTWKMRVNT